MINTQLASLFVDDQGLPWEPAADGVKRKIMTYDANLMMVKVAFETGGVGAAHSHFHTQMSYVERGVFSISIADETRIVRAGDAYYIPPMYGTEPFVLKLVYWLMFLRLCAKISCNNNTPSLL